MRQRGFTLVEVLVVLAIIIMLFSLVTVSVGPVFRSAYEKSTKGMLLRLQSYLEAYRRLAGSYPPDGIDSRVENDQGTALRGSASLYYHLTRPIIVEVVQGGVPKPREYPPVVTTPFKSNELTEELEDYPGAREIIDGWGDPIHYDNTEDGVYRPQGGDVHIPPVDDDDHPIDPREPTYLVRDEPAVPRPGEVQARGYDLWSSAGQGDDDEEENQLPIASWNLQE